MLDGGIPRGRIVLVIGSSGTGKTVLSTQFIVEGLRTGESGVFVSLDEDKEHYYSEMLKFGWDIAEYERKKLFLFVDASPVRTLPGTVKIGNLTIGKREFSMLSLVEVIRSSVHKIDAKRLVVDPLTSLIFQYPDPVIQRNAMMDLVETLLGTGTTCLLTASPDSVASDAAPLQLSHGVIALQNSPTGDSYGGTLQVLKMRGTSADRILRPYAIVTDKGIEVFSHEAVATGRRGPKPSSRRVFIVHGKDEENKEILRKMIQDWGFEPVILAEQPNRGRTLIEKLIDHTSDAGYVFVLMTEDDVGASKSDFLSILGVSSLQSVEFVKRIAEVLSPRARQNVIFEYGLCIGAVGRERVCLLTRGDIEIPTDVLGYGYIHFKEKVSECEKEVKRELKAVGYAI